MWIDAFTCTQIFLCLCLFSELSSECSAARRKDKSQQPAISDQMNVMDNRWRHKEAKNRHRNNMADEDMNDEMYDVMDPDDTVNLSTNNEKHDVKRSNNQHPIEGASQESRNRAQSAKEVEPPRRKKIDPKGSWFSFVKYSEDRTGDKNSERRKKKRNRKHRNKTLHGPPGPAGPPGPPGPPGTSITKEEIIADLQELIKDAAEKRAQELLSTMIDKDENRTSISLADDVTSQFLSIPRIYAGFSMRLKTREIVQRKSLKELKLFQQPFGPGSFQRGDSFNTDEGRFVVPRDGVYHFTASLRLKVRSKKKPKPRIKSSEYVEVSICIDSMCKTNTSIATITGITKHKQLFTATITGTLHLQEKQYTSVYIDNASSFNIIIMSGSEYSGLFLGV